MTENLTLASEDGLNLEAALDAPKEPSAVLVLCHPHPKMGGTMNAPLLLALVGHLVERSWAVLRFNFRGIGASEGDAGLGVAEVADALGAIGYARQRFPGLGVAIAGWSFGGAVAVRAAARTPGLAAIVGIAPAVKEKPGITAGLPDPEGLALDAPLLVICGVNDELVMPSDAAEWTRTSGGTFVEMKGANHFFWAKYDDLAEVVGDFLDTNA